MTNVHCWGNRGGWGGVGKNHGRWGLEGKGASKQERREVEGQRGLDSNL